MGVRDDEFDETFEGMARGRKTAGIGTVVAWIPDLMVKMGARP